ncbi:RNA-directed DNA polymerase [Streptomyces ferrugineus]|uniref:RNA-directed DNA polymerase n=1 Tax=Streptomyces ferrugineus TaxID=1413221 RepID=A0A7M2SG50_9ACTN|nr:RNA-directed DNA polymerase [Streptomyces ferrugineus]QOV35252.1 RNA-directed DNA polymerase [Streptomyces ferrugineus]
MLTRTLSTAKDLLVRNQGYSEIPDVAAYADIEHQWDRGYRKTLEGAIRDGDCTPTHTEIVDYPKNSITFRPLARFSARDRLIYDALIFSAAAGIDKQIRKHVYSYRWDHNTGKPRFWYQPWRRMQTNARRTLESDSWLRMATLDVSSFYEHIDVDILGDDLACLSKSSDKSRNLNRFLVSFQRINHAWGLPQGSDASGILANLYLAPVDEYLTKNGFKYLRYSDDIMIFRRDWTELRDVLSEINRILRARRLSMSTQKTGILDPEDAFQRIHDVRKASLSAACDIGIPGAHIEVRQYFDEVIKEDSSDTRSLRFVINRLAKLQDDYAVSWCLDNLPFLAHVAKEVFSYLAIFANRVEEVQRKLVNFMRSGASKSYPYLEQRILRYFLAMNLLDHQMKESAWLILEDRNREDFPREFASRYLGRAASVSEAQLLRHKFEEEPSITMRRALLMALYESRNLSARYLNDVEEYLPQLKWVCKFLRDEPRIPVS